MTLTAVEAVQRLQAQEALSLHSGITGQQAAEPAVQQALFESLMQQAGPQLASAALPSQDAMQDEDA